MTDFDKNAVMKSYGRCCVKPEFWDRFYDIFQDSAPEIRPMFADTDFDRQKEIINESLNFVLIYAKDPNNVVAKKKLEKIADIHSRHRVNVRPDMYKYWIDSLLQTIQEFEKDNYTMELEKNWRAALSPAIELLKSRY